MSREADFPDAPAFGGDLAFGFALAAFPTRAFPTRFILLISADGHALQHCKQVAHEVVRMDSPAF
jgi:hypothetical protein